MFKKLNLYSKQYRPCSKLAGTSFQLGAESRAKLSYQVVHEQLRESESNRKLKCEEYIKIFWNVLPVVV